MDAQSENTATILPAIQEHQRTEYLLQHRQHVIMALQDSLAWYHRKLLRADQREQQLLEENTRLVNARREVEAERDRLLAQQVKAE